MNKHNRKILHGYVAAICVSLLLAACSSGGGGGGGGTVNEPLPSGMFVKTIEPSHTGGFTYPLRTNPYSRDQHLVLAIDIKGSGYIGSISFRLANSVVSVVTCSRFTVKMGHTLLTGLTNTFANNVEQGQDRLETVRSSAHFIVPIATAGDYFTINFDNPFYYNGVDNLVAEFIGEGGCSSDVPLTYSTMANASLVSVTNGDATGTQLTAYLNMKLNFKGGNNAVEFIGALTSSPLPFISGARVRIQNLYLASDITGTGPITGIGFQLGGVSSDGTYTYTMKLGHTTRSALTTTFADNFDAGAPVTVADQATFTLPGGMPAGAYFWIPFPGTFIYNGTDNLLVDLDVTAGTGANATYLANVGSGRSAMGDSGNTVANNGLGPLVFLAKFRFYGGTMDAMTPGNVTYSLPFTTGSSPKVQSYYGPSMMGSAGTISRIAFRLRNDSAADTYNNAVIVMGHTVASGLTTTFADNMVDAQTVFSGTLTIPAGMKAGDWFEIPLSTAFAYDGKRSLVVQTASDAGAFSNAIFAGTSSYYTNRVAWSLDRTLPTGALQPIVLDQRFWYSK